MPKITEICSSVADYLNSKNLGVSFNAAYANLEFTRREEESGPVAYVAPSSVSLQNSTRNSWLANYEITITLTCVMRMHTLQEQESMIHLAESIPLDLLGVDQSGAKMMSVAGDSPNAIFEQDEFKNMNFFIATIPLTYTDITGS